MAPRFKVSTEIGETLGSETVIPGLLGKWFINHLKQQVNKALIPYLCGQATHTPYPSTYFHTCQNIKSK